MLIFEFKNAFNTVDRAEVLAKLQQFFLGVSRWAQWCYGQHSRLYFGNMDLASATGVQQGDPIGPLLFACSIHPLVLKLEHLFREGIQVDPDGVVLFYLDDGVLCGDVQTVAASLEIIAGEATGGLKLNLSKCELILPAGTCAMNVSNTFPRELLVDERGNNRIIRGGGFEFLGAPVGTNDFCEGHALERVNKAKKLL